MGRITGDTPHGSSDQGNPLGVGGYAKGSAPTAVTAGQRVKGWFDLFGRLRASISPATDLQTTLRTNSADASGAAVDVTAAPGAGKYLHIDNIIVGAAADMTVTFTEETSGTVVAVVHLLANTSFRTGCLGKLATANKKLKAQASAAGAVNITVVSRSE
jgi:hypothetical protein